MILCKIRKDCLPLTGFVKFCRLSGGNTVSKQGNRYRCRTLTIHIIHIVPCYCGFHIGAVIAIAVPIGIGIDAEVIHLPICIVGIHCYHIANIIGALHRVAYQLAVTVKNCLVALLVINHCKRIPLLCLQAHYALLCKLDTCLGSCAIDGDLKEGISCILFCFVPQREQCALCQFLDPKLHAYCDVACARELGIVQGKCSTVACVHILRAEETNRSGGCAGYDTVIIGHRLVRKVIPIIVGVLCVVQDRSAAGVIGIITTQGFYLLHRIAQLVAEGILRGKILERTLPVVGGTQLQGLAFYRCAVAVQLHRQAALARCAVGPIHLGGYIHALGQLFAGPAAIGIHLQIIYAPCHICVGIETNVIAGIFCAALGFYPFTVIYLDPADIVLLVEHECNIHPLFGCHGSYCTLKEFHRYDIILTGCLENHLPGIVSGLISYREHAAIDELICLQLHAEDHVLCILHYITHNAGGAVCVHEVRIAACKARCAGSHEQRIA